MAFIHIGSKGMSDVHYFAYGSNMNPERVTARGIEYSEILSGHLFGYELVFNSILTSVVSGEHCEAHDEVGGVLYLLADAEQIAKMDPFEGSHLLHSEAAEHCDGL